MSAPVFTAAPFMRSHCTPPRGRGSWAFQASTSESGYDEQLVGDVLFVSGTFTEARAAAREHFKHERIVAVLP